MGKAWNSGTKKPFAEKLVIYWRTENGCRVHYLANEDGTEPVNVARSWAEHQVCSGNARYVEVKS